MTLHAHCELCNPSNETVLVNTARWRLIAVNEPDFVGFTRVIWNHHVKEMSDLSDQDQADLMQVVLRVEKVMRRELAPDKINLASLGNQTPHVHWHIIARWHDDVAYPAPIWNHPAADAQRSQQAASRAGQSRGRLTAYHQALINEFALDT